MQFLTPQEWQNWCADRNIPLQKSGRVRPDFSDAHFHIVKIPYPSDSGKKVALARHLFSLVAPDPESLLLLDEWAVWPSSQHMPLFTRFREAFGEKRALIESPGHLITPADSEDGISIIGIALLFFWDCYGICSSGQNVFHVSHDEFCIFASRDGTEATRISDQLGTA